MRKFLGAGLLLAALVGLWTAAVVTQGVQCGGSFVPSLNCTVSGRFNFTNVTTSVNTTTQGPIPFQAGGVDVTGIVSRVTDLTNADILTLGSTPVTVVPAPGAGYYVDVISVNLIFNYTAAYTSGGNMRLFYGTAATGNAASALITASGLLVSVTADAIERVSGVPDSTDPPTTNLAVVLATVTGVNFATSTAGNTLRVVVNYRIVRTGL
jgi:hypothetical protein